MTTNCQVCGESTPCTGTTSHRLRNVAQGLQSAHTFMKKTSVIVQVFASDAAQSGIQKLFPLPFGCPFRIDCGHGVIATGRKATLHRETKDLYLICDTDATIYDLSKVLQGLGWEHAVPIPEFTL